MAIPLATTLISVLRLTGPESSGEPYAGTLATDRTVISTGVRAHIGAPSGVEVMNGGEQSQVTFRLDCDPTDLTHLDWVRDDVSGQVYWVVWARPRTGLGLNHTVAELRIVEGVA